ncbi:hypothetical protein [Prauserella aidingensis]|uniref:hypothetical protein n=1 Tax=Prauserella aidingensis TaxID=387890 RepID=UPI0020A4B939|nr:hypothetical protein [Prauserella aidingensis]
MTPNQGCLKSFNNTCKVNTVPTRRNLFISVVSLFVIAWIVIATLAISRQPDIGVDSATELRTRLEHALNNRDSVEIEELIAYPPSDADEFAKNYIGELVRIGAHSISVTLQPSTENPSRALVEGGRSGGEVFSYLHNVRKSQGQWRIELTPPV